MTHEESLYNLDKTVQKIKIESNSRLNTINDLKNKLGKNQNELLLTLSQKDKGLELFEGRWVKKEDIPKLKEIRVGLTTNFSNLTGFEFEYFVARLLQEMGFEVEVTKKTGDYGIDIIAMKDNKIVAVQCKRYAESNLIGNRDIQRCLGSMHKVKAKSSIFVTTSYFTKQALQQAERAPIELWDKDTFHSYVEKYLLSLNINEILGPIELAHQNEKKMKDLEEQEKLLLRQKKINERIEKKRKSEEKKELERAKAICPRCHRRKMKTRKYCAHCKEELRKKRSSRKRNAWW